MLNYNVRGENIEVTEALRDYAQKRLDKLNRYLEGDATANVNLRVYPHDKSSKAEVTVLLPTIVLRAEDHHDDLYEALDRVADKLERQIRKYKTRINRKTRDTGFKGIVDPIEEVPAEVESDETTIVRTKNVDLKPMSAEEAALQMDLLGHTFFVYQDADSDATNIVYKRRDGKYALIETN
ncbi:MAG TPA: ribosome-associated translation inhibitor RaiA [Lactobacillaceae bacterium]|jgi:ribosomal subunit interface protein